MGISTEEMTDGSVNNSDERKVISTFSSGTASRVDFCEQLSLHDVQLLVEVRHQENDAEIARTLVHQYVHVLLHFDVDD